MAITLLKTLGIYFAITIVLFALSQVDHVHSQDDNFYNMQPCGKLYSEENLQGQSFPLEDQDQSVDLREDQRTSINGWAKTKSLVVEDSCKMKVCNETYFDDEGECETLAPGSYSGENLPFTIESASCVCPKQCNCSNIHIKLNSCGRAYLEGGCSTCHALYTDLETDISKTLKFPEEFSKSVEAFRIRRGCKLTIYTHENFKGRKKLFQEETVEDFQSMRMKIGSYKCDCDDTMYVPRVPRTRPESYPPLLNIPTDMNEIIKMIENAAYKNHPGLHAARRSYRNKRSPTNAYILLIGTTGAGKSSAINLLFDNPNVTKVGDRVSTTSSIHEFRIPVGIDELGIANSELRVIDTPGLGDTRGLEHDAMFLATLENYLSTHEELKNRIPNLVLIFHKFSDNRFDGQGSNYVKMIRGFDDERIRKRITDENFSNVVFVFSHFMSTDRSTRRKPDERIKIFKEVIQDYSLFPRPTHVVLAENKAKEEQLPMINGYFKLPNNDYYTRNLFEKMDLIAEKCGDPIGQGVFRTAFRDSENFNVSRLDYPLLSTSTSEVQQYLGVLTNANLNVENTEVSQKLKTVWDSQISQEIKMRYPFSLAYLQKALNLRKINNLLDVPRTSVKMIELMAALKQDPATRQLLEIGLGVQAPVFPTIPIAGYGYHVFQDRHLATSPFQLSELEHSDIGFRIPSSLTCNIKPGSKELFAIFEDKSEYLQHRLQSLGIKGNIPVDKFTDTVQPGCNVKAVSFKSDGCSVSAAKDFRLFELTLNDKVVLAPEFENAVRRLFPVNTSDHSSVTQWTEFFNLYGTHVVQSAYGGGSIQVQLKSNQPYDPQFAEAMFNLVKFAEDLTYQLDYVGDEGTTANSENTSTTEEPVNIAVSETETSFNNGSNVELETTQTTIFIGGNPTFHTTNLEKMPLTDASALLSNWKQSLTLNPAMLAAEMRLVPISRIVDNLGQNYTEEIERATQLLFSSDLIYKPPFDKSELGPGSSRDETPIMQEMLRMMREQAERAEMAKLEQAKIDQENQRRQHELEAKRIELQKELAEKEADYRREQDEAKRLAEVENRAWAEKQEQARREHELNVAKLNKELEEQKAEQVRLAEERATAREEAKQKRLKEEREEAERKAEKLRLELKAEQAAKEERERQFRIEQELREQKRAEEHRKFEAEQAKIKAEEAKLAADLRKLELETQERIRQEEAKRREQDREDERRRQQAAADDARRRWETMATQKPIIIHQPSGGGGRCLRNSTLVMMADGSQQIVELLNVGDILLDKNLQPTRLVGLSKEFLLDQKFYGFRKDGPFFFTSNHLFAGPLNNTKQDEFQLYAASPSVLYEDNPLMSNRNVKSISENSSLYQVDSLRGMVMAKNVEGAFEDPEEYRSNTVVYDLQVDSPTGTYFANGYVCSQEVPPLQMWSNTMSILLRLLDTPMFETILPSLPYNVENVVRMQTMVKEIAGKVAKFFKAPEKVQFAVSSKSIFETTGEEDVLMTLENINVEESISKLFRSSCASTVALKIYSEIGPIIAGVLDPDVQNGHTILDEPKIALLQHQLFDLIISEIEKRL